MKKAIIFDLDGTLVNSLPDISAAMNRALEKHGLSAHPMDAYRYFVGNGAINLTKRAVGEHQDLTDAVFAEYRKDYMQNSRVHSYAYEGTHEMLKLLQEAGLRLCVVSNKDDGDVKSVLDYYFPENPFTLTRGRKADVPIKPAPDMVNAVMEKLGVTPDECWYLGDTATDMQTAHNAGISDVAGALWGFRTQEELESKKAKYIVKSPLSFAALVTENL